VFISEEILI